MRPVLATARAAAVWLLALAVVTAAGGAQDAPSPDSSTGESAAFAQPDSRAALNEGNRRFRDGQIEAAVEAYLRGYSPAAPHPTLLYNLGTALHHLDRLPEAILWYRRATESDDLWLKDNLLLARRSLGSQILPPGGTLGWLGRHVDGLRLVAIVLVWIIFLLYAANAKTPKWLVFAVALVACSLYGGAAAVERWGPRPAVILADCLSPAGELPAGTEAWVRRTGGGWMISGSEVVCPEDTVELVFQRP